MRRFRHISLMLALLITCHTVGDELWAKGGHSGSKGGGNSFHGSAGHASQNVDALCVQSKDPSLVAERETQKEIRKLKMRMEAVKRLRAKAAQTGNESLVKVADRLEQRALERFHQRMNQIAEYRRQHGLPDIKHHLEQ